MIVSNGCLHNWRRYANSASTRTHLQLLARLRADWPHAFDEAASLDKAVEIDAYPDRQDLNLDLFEVAAGVTLRGQCLRIADNRVRRTLAAMGISTSRLALDCLRTDCAPDGSQGPFPCP